MELQMDLKLHAKMFAIDASLKSRGGDNGLPLRIITSFLTRTMGTEELMEAMNTGCIPTSSTEKDYIDLVIDDADKIYNWITK